jgi:hypothetical protein
MATTKTLHFHKRIGSTLYKVAIHQSHISKETLEDKILRLAKNDINITPIKKAVS